MVEGVDSADWAVEEPGSRIRTFEDLDCWKACRNLRLFIVRTVVPSLPSHEKFRLSDQLIRAARSTTANIAEGYGRYHYLENAKFCRNSRGSCSEVLDHLITGNDEGLLNDDLYQEGRLLVEQALQILNGYINYLQRAHQAEK